HDADAFGCVPGSLQEIETAVSERGRIAVADGAVRKRRAGAVAEVDGGAGLLREFLVSGDEVGVEMGLDDMLDAQAELGRGLQVNGDVALGIDDGRNATGPDQVRGVGEASKIELFEDHRSAAYHGRRK